MAYLFITKNINKKEIKIKIFKYLNYKIGTIWGQYAIGMKVKAAVWSKRKI